PSRGGGWRSSTRASWTEQSVRRTKIGGEDLAPRCPAAVDPRSLRRTEAGCLTVPFRLALKRRAWHERLRQPFDHGVVALVNVRPEVHPPCLVDLDRPIQQHDGDGAIEEHGLRLLGGEQRIDALLAPALPEQQQR